MKKNIWLSIVCITISGVAVNAQTHKAPPPPPAPPMDIVALLPAPPPIPPTPPEPVDNIAPEPPLPPIQPCPEPLGSTIINNNGYEVSVSNIRGRDYVLLKKDRKETRIKLSTWNSNRKYYEKKYGQLPPTPPPAPLVKEITEE